MAQKNNIIAEDHMCGSERVQIGIFKSLAQKDVKSCATFAGRTTQVVDESQLRGGASRILLAPPYNLSDICYPFKKTDLKLILWATYNFPSAATALVAAENAATDDPTLRPTKNPYIADCLAAIARRREQVEDAAALFDAGIGGEALDKLCEATEARRATIGAAGGSDVVSQRKRAAAGRRTKVGNLYAEAG